MENSVRDFLNKISQNSDLNCFVEVFEQEAIEKEHELKNSDSKSGPLAGLVFGIKDLFNYTNHEITASSGILKNYTSLYNSTVVERILAADGIIIGRQNCDEFGMGSTNENSVYGAAKNPLNREYVAGGSSGGSAAAVAADLCDISIGTDTGGSVRLPASYCGVIGLKPTYGLIPRHGVISYASSFDTVGIIGKNLDKIAETLTCIHGSDSFDSTAIRQEKKNFADIPGQNKKLKIGYFGNIMSGGGVQEEIKTDFNKLKDSIEKDGHELKSLDFEFMDYLLPTYYILTTAEASSNLSRYDGIRYGNNMAKGQNDLVEYYYENRSNGFGDEVKRRILLGSLVLSSGYSDAFFIKAQKVRKLILSRIEKIFEEFDFILLPTSPSKPPKIGELVDDPLKMYLGDIFTVLPSITGIPAISLPLGDLSYKLKSGIQVLGKAYSELELFSFSQYILGLKN